jgi:hypothetical protein
MALERELRTASDLDADDRLLLRRVLAKTWEGPLHNRYEALEAWQKLLAEQADNAEARESVSRIKAGGQLRSTLPPPLERPLEPMPEGDPEPTSGEVPCSDLAPDGPISDVLLLEELAIEPLDSGEISLEPSIDELARPPAAPRASLPPPLPPPRSAPPVTKRPEPEELLEVADFELIDDDDPS